MLVCGGIFVLCPEAHTFWRVAPVSRGWEPGETQSGRQKDITSAKRRLHRRPLVREEKHRHPSTMPSFAWPEAGSQRCAALLGKAALSWPETRAVALPAAA